MSNNSSSNKRIAKNTGFLYIRMLLLMFVSFFTSRVVLDKLGIVDFGIHNVVGGLASMFVFFRSSLSNVTQRYLNIELGKGDEDAAQTTFCQHQTLYIFMMIAVVALAETIGLWFVYHKLNIPAERFEAALWVYQFTIISLAMTILSIVYESAIIAHEDMKIYSYVGIYEGVAKLVIAYIISIIPYDRLITYSFLLKVVSISVILYYIYYCSKHYRECHFHFVWSKKKIHEAFAMISWNTIGTAVWAINDQGINVLLNLFFGPAVNAARGVAFQINNAINNFGNNFYVAVRPQLVKSYASQNFDYLYKLFFSSSKFSVYLLWIFCLPVSLCIDTILSLWLKEVPPHTNHFTILILAYSMVNILNNPIWSLALAIGKLKWYILIGSGVFLMSFPISYICLKIGCSPESVFIVNILVRMIYICVVINILKRYIPISIKRYMSDVIVPVLLVVSISGLSSWICSISLPNTLLNQLFICVLCWGATAICILTIGLQKGERTLLYATVNKKLKLKRL